MGLSFSNKNIFFNILVLINFPLLSSILQSLVDLRKQLVCLLDIIKDKET